MLELLPGGCFTATSTSTARPNSQQAGVHTHATPWGNCVAVRTKAKYACTLGPSDSTPGGAAGNLEHTLLSTKGQAQECS